MGKGKAVMSKHTKSPCVYVSDDDAFGEIENKRDTR